MGGDRENKHRKRSRNDTNGGSGSSQKRSRQKTHSAVAVPAAPATAQPPAAPVSTAATCAAVAAASWAPIADRLNPNRRAFDPAFKSQWQTLGKKQRKKLISADRLEIAALKARSESIVHPFAANPDDHCETRCAPL